MKVVKTWSGILLFTLFWTASLQAQTRESLLKTIEKDPVCTATGVAKEYDEKNIQSLSGKTAATLKHYGLIGVTVQDWNGSGGRVHLILYEMVDPSAAYGFFTLERDIEQAANSDIPIGTEGFHSGSRTYIWQSKYVVEVEGDAKPAESLARLVSENIFGRSKKPPVSDLLPPNGLVAGSEKYIIDAEGVDPSLGLDAAKLGFDDSVEIATARYKINGKPATLVLLLYPTQQLAKKYFDAMHDNMSNDDPFSQRTVALISMIRGSRDQEAAKEILGAVGYETKTTWSDAHFDITLKQVILTIFTFIGIALLFTLVAGMSFGGLRIFLKSKYPGRFGDRHGDAEIIQLKLIQEVTPKELGK